MMRVSHVLLLTLVLTLARPVAARTTIEVVDLVVDGLAVRDLECQLERGGLLAGAVIVGALAKQKKAIAACAPDGDAARLSFVFGAGKTGEINVVGASKASLGTCVQRALAKVAAPDEGTCTATILTADNDAARKAAAALKAPPKPEKEPNWTEHYANPAAWTTLSNAAQGWQLWVPDGATAKDSGIEIGKDTWRGAIAEHRHQLLWVFWHPSAELSPAIVAQLTHDAVAKTKDVTWHPVTTLPAREDFPETVIDKALSSPHRLLRLASRGKHGSWFIMTLFSEAMPDDVVLTWLKSVTFTTPE